jgi:hypothetical protein
MGTPTRFPGGLNTTALPLAMSMMGQLDPSKFHTFFTDFDTYTAADWTVTEVGVATQALTAGDGGLLLVTNAAADNDSSFQQNVVASFLMAAGKKAFFKCRFQVSDATQSDIQMGLIIADTTPMDATDGIYFQKDDGDAQIDVIVRKDATTGSTTETNVATLVAATNTVWAWYFDGVDTVRFYVDDALVATLDGTSTYLPDANLSVSFGLQNGEAVAKTMTVDYIFAAKER